MNLITDFNKDFNMHCNTDANKKFNTNRNICFITILIYGII